MVIEKPKTNNHTTNSLFSIESMAIGLAITNVIEVMLVGFAPHIQSTIATKWPLWQTSMTFLGLVVASQLASGFLLKMSCKE